jgi:endonuclease YncB( thermonuclease family)
MGRQAIPPARFLWLLLVLVVGPGPAVGQESATVARVLAGNLLELGDGGVVRLAGIRPPDAGGLAAQAQAALAGLVEHRELRLEPANQARDRHGRLVAQLWRDDGLWLQGALLDQGLAQVQTRPGEVALAAKMSARERAARESGVGVWARGGLTPIPAAEVRRLVGSFQIVEGRVVRVALTERYVYLNFGADWRTDFTLRVARKGERGFRQAGIELEELAGREVEVRGYVLEAGGPLIELSHPEQIWIRPEPGSGDAEPAS